MKAQVNLFWTAAFFGIALSTKFIPGISPDATLYALTAFLAAWGLAYTYAEHRRP